MSASFSNGLRGDKGQLQDSKRSGVSTSYIKKWTYTHTYHLEPHTVSLKL